MWNAGEEMEEDLRNTYLDMEGEIEEWSDAVPVVGDR